jgi:hypothetical protein
LGFPGARSAVFTHQLPFPTKKSLLKVGANVPDVSCLAGPLHADGWHRKVAFSQQSQGHFTLLVEKATGQEF